MVRKNLVGMTAEVGLFLPLRVNQKHVTVTRHVLYHGYPFHPHS